MRYRTIPELPLIEGTAAALIAAAALALAVTASGCATVQKGPETIQAPVSREVQREAQKEASIAEQRVLKRKIAISRFTNETRYGKTLLGSASVDPLGKQVSDMLSVRLVQSARFMVFERQGMADLEKEQKISGAADLVGVDAVILGSITEFGRTTTGTRGFLSATKKQTARAKVEVRLHRVAPQVLEGIGLEFVHQSDAPPFVTAYVQHHANASVGDQPHRFIELRPAVAP